MKAGRNDPCPCGSGKKYKKCCLGKEREASLRETAAIPPPTSPVGPLRPVPSRTPRHPRPVGSTAPALAERARTPPPPPDPVTERAEGLWREFESQDGKARIALFRDSLEDAVAMTDDMAFELLNTLHADAVASGDRARFAQCVAALRERRPDVFDEGAHYYLSWSLLDALAEGRQEVVPSLARELAARDIDIFNRSVEALGDHGELTILVEALRIAWPFVKSSDNVVPWGISQFAQRGVRHEIYDYLEHTDSPDPADAALLDRVRFFIDEPDADDLREFIGDLTGSSGREWQADDFALRPLRKGRENWDDEPEERLAPDPSVTNLGRLTGTFVGYLRREEGVPSPRGELVRHKLYSYLLRRDAGDLDPRPSMLEQALDPKRKLPKPPPPPHPLCLERVTLDVHLAQMMGMLSGRYYPAAALFQPMPAWLRFLESRRLIDTVTSRKVAAELLALHDTLPRIWKKHTEDPLLYRQELAWPAYPKPTDAVPVGVRCEGGDSDRRYRNMGGHF